MVHIKVYHVWGVVDAMVVAKLDVVNAGKKRR